KERGDFHENEFLLRIGRHCLGNHVTGVVSDGNFPRPRHPGGPAHPGGKFWLGFENGFGSNTPVTLPPDRRPPPGKSTGIPVTKTPSSVLINAQPKYFRPR